jgi:hypothetical protein
MANWLDDELMRTEVGGKDFAKAIVIGWLIKTGGSNLKLLETVTGLPQKLLSPLLAEMMEQRVVSLDKVVFKPSSRWFR